MNTDFFVVAFRVLLLHNFFTELGAAPRAAADIVSVVSSSLASGICREIGEPCVTTSDCCSSFPTLRALGFSTFSLNRNKSTGVECVDLRCDCGPGFRKQPFGIILTCVPESELSDSHLLLPESPIRNKPTSYNEGLTYLFWFCLVLLFKGLFVCFCLGKRRANAEARNGGQDETDSSVPKRDLPPPYESVVREAPPSYEVAVGNLNSNANFRSNVNPVNVNGNS